MGTINKIRLINLSYNNGGIQISDETLNLNGISTLLSLQNGGGKSVLVQMLTAPFVHKNYRRVKDRPFESYFTGTKPSFILIEWNLDGSSGKMMNGFMIRRRPEETGEGTEEKEVLEITGLISEYTNACPWDITNLPVVEKTKKEMLLKSYTACKQLFEGFKKDRQARFFYYDIGQPSQQRQYFEKLKEYRVDYREWENIIKKVNQKEGGLADLFADCRDEKGLTEKWLLDAVEKKLDPEGIKIRDFEKNIASYSRQCYENEDKIKRRDDIRKFRALVDPLEESADDSVSSYALLLKEADDAIRTKESQLILFLMEIKRLTKAAEEVLAQKQEEIDSANERVGQLIYERFSEEILRLQQEKEELEGNLRITGLELEALERELAAGERMVHLLEMKRTEADRLEELRKREELKKRLEATKQKDADLRPRREELGGLLYQYYENEVLGTEKRLSDSEETIRTKTGLTEDKAKELKTLDRDISQTERLLGTLEQGIRSYDRTEEAYLSDFGGEFRRNILGRYEEGTLIIEQERLLQLKKETGEKRRSEKAVQQEKELLEKKLVSDLSELRIRKNDLAHQTEQAEKALADSQEQKAVREDILTYLKLGSGMLFDTKGILAAFDARLSTLDAQIRTLQEKETEKKQELTSLSEGRIAELPAPFTEGLKRQGIPLSFGMEWLKKNGKKKPENLRLVRENPFLPYSLILTEGELKRLATTDPALFTDFPVPILLRNDLEKGIISENNIAGPVTELNGVRFYVHFNENLLDEKAFAELLNGIRNELVTIAEQLSIRKNEREEYIQKRELIRTQTLSAEGLDALKKELEELALSREETEHKLSELEAAREENRELLLQLSTRIEALDKKEIALTEQLRRTKELAAWYEEYLELLLRREQAETKLKEEGARKELLSTYIERLREEIQAEREKAGILRHALSDLKENTERFSAYRTIISAPDSPVSRLQTVIGEEEKDSLEAEYRVITEKLSGEVRYLEESLAEQEKRLQKAVNSEERLKKKYDLQPEEWRDLLYSEEALDRQQEKNQELGKKREAKTSRYHEEDKKISVKQAHIEDRFRRMENETGYSEILPAERITAKNFEEEINVLKHTVTVLEKEKQKLTEQLQQYGNLQTSLAEYEGMTPEGEQALEKDCSLLTQAELTEYRGTLGRELKQLSEERQKRRNRLTDRLNDLLLIPEFRDDYYRKPLEAMLRSADTPREILRQIATTIQSYEDLMKKLEVDLSVIEEERDRIQGMIASYIRDVHVELGKIDSNSTIPVRDRSIKMLTISLPGWQENEEIYQIRIRDELEEVVNHCLGICKKNENMDEYIGTRINIRELYDAVVGIGNVGIRLYKIEKEREYPISWAEVAKNSGGEGFLSTFVILSSLLYYMRRDDNDMFAERNDGKVLLMDNPFGLTYSEHLLKPLMELAKKNNTQLICLSGLGGDAIYGRFDNIYVLNLVAAGLRGGLQYLRSDHLRGNDPEVIVSSQFEVLEQMTLF